MRSGKPRALPVLALVLVAVIAVPLGGAAGPPDDTADRPHSQNMHLIGSSLKAGAVTGPPPAGPGEVPWDTRNTDLAFWGTTTIQGRYDGFRVIDVQAPGNPRDLAFFTCVSPQGDVGVYGNLVFRSVDSPQRTDQCTTQSQSGNPTGVDCAPASSPCTGFEGIQIFDISDLSDIQHIASVPLDCGSHTHTVVPDAANGRVLIYNSVSGVGATQQNPGKYGNRCPAAPMNREDIVEVPLADPASASVIGSFPLGQLEDGTLMNACHDFGVVLGSANLGACAGHPRGVAVFDLTDLESPVFKYAVEAPTVTGWHSAAFTWDGSILVTGWEPGGGTAPRCMETGTPIGGGQVQTDEMKTLFFYDTETGEMVGRHVLPRPQSQYENCTMHNYNIAPNPKRNLLVHGSYQSGTALVDFTDLDNIYEVAWMDPDPLDPPSETSPGGRTNFRGGDWSSYWYNGFIYESDTRRGLYVWKVSAPEVSGPDRKLAYLNPQTNHQSLDEKGKLVD
ncbi:MAG TPA: hypothetical protein VK915_01565 [Gaiellaceae bacterium]|nr:hypothetical protein [Gaiellaceae bacterium]